MPKCMCIILNVMHVTPHSVSHGITSIDVFDIYGSSLRGALIKMKLKVPNLISSKGNYERRIAIKISVTYN